MNRVLKRTLQGFGAVLGVAAIGLGVFVYTQTSAFDASLEKVYDVAPLALARSTDPAVIARGKHLAESIGACAGSDCHGVDLGGGKPIAMGPLGTLSGPNISPGGVAAAYSDGELARLIRHGVKKDGRGLRFMPVPEINWLPDSDLVAIISYVRSVPAVDRPNGPVQIGTLGKVLDRRDQVVLDVARKIDHAHIETAPPPTPTVAYGKFIGRLCTGCHGEQLSGGPIPGAPSSFPTPLNITPHASGMKEWTLADFDHLLDTGVRKNGKQLDKFMPLEQLRNMDRTERDALFAFLQSLPPREFGGR